MAINILLLSAAKSSSDGNFFPKCLSEVGGETVLEIWVRRLGAVPCGLLHFAFLEIDIRKFHLDRIAQNLAPKSRTYAVQPNTMGSGCTALFCVSSMDTQSELLLVSSNELVDVDFSAVLSSFRERGLDAGTIVFNSFHPRYSYVKLNDEGLVTEAAQKNPISSYATAGVFWFKSGRDFLNGVMSCIRKDATVDDQFFVAPVFNELILMDRVIGVHKIPLNAYVPLKDQSNMQNVDRRNCQ